MQLARWPQDVCIIDHGWTGRRIVTAYDEVRSLLVDERLSADRMYAFADRAPPGAVAAVRRHAPWLISPQGADYSWIGPMVHAGLRSATEPASQASTVDAAGELVDRLIQRDRFDVVGDYALALAGLMLADLLGLDRRDGDRLIGWGLDVIAFFNDVEFATAPCERMARSVGELVCHAHAVLREARPEHDRGFLARVARAAERRGRVLDDEAIGNVTLPLVTGHVDLAHLVAATVYQLLTHDDQRAAVAREPRLAAGAVVETLRYGSPVAFVPRIALEPVGIRGDTIARGETVYLSLAAANRDPARFPNPNRFDVSRPMRGALGLGHGRHTCVGAGLVRSHAALSVATLFRRAPELTLDAGCDIAWRAIPGVRALQTLDVRLASTRAGPRH
jgi:cytochrome P450